MFLPAIQYCCILKLECIYGLGVYQSSCLQWEENNCVNCGAFAATLLMLATCVLCYNYLVDHACMVITLLDKGSVLYKTT